MGGLGLSATVELYDPVAGTWSVTGSTAPRVQHTATLLPDGTVVVAGGYNEANSTPIASSVVYDPGTGTWRGGLRQLLAARFGHTATALSNGSVLVVAGRNQLTLELASAELFPVPPTFASAAVGVGKPVTVPGLLLSGTSAANYTLLPPTGITADITAKAVTATLVAADKAYDGTTTEPNGSMGCTLAGVLASDSANVTCTATSGAFDGAAAGAHTVAATMTIGGSASGNYTLGGVGTSVSSASGTATTSIGQAASTTTVMCPVSVTYNGAAQTPCTVAVTGAGGLNLTPAPVYGNNTNPGTASASYAFASDANHTGSADSRNFTIANAPATDVSSQVTVARGGFRLVVATGRFQQTVTVTKNAGTTLGAPVLLVLDALSANATAYLPAGTTSCTSPAGSPYVTVNVGADALFTPGEVVTMALEFVNPTRAGISYTTRVLAGGSCR